MAVLCPVRREWLTSEIDLSVIVQKRLTAIEYAWQNRVIIVKKSHYALGKKRTTCGWRAVGCLADRRAGRMVPRRPARHRRRRAALRSAKRPSPPRATGI